MKPKHPWTLLATVVIFVTVALVAWVTEPHHSSAKPPAASSASTTTLGSLIPPKNIPDPVVVAAGDIACPPNQPVTPTTCQMKATADLVSQLHPTAVLALGDLQYDGELGTNPPSPYDQSWGQFSEIVYPAPGNHDYERIPGYFNYFSTRAVEVGQPGSAYYSFDLGSWHLLALDANSGKIDAAQIDWLKADLAAHHSACTLAYWHEPLFTSGTTHRTDGLASRQFWEALQGADIVLGGHEHNYEQFAPQTADGKQDAHGTREFVVGTGGYSLYRDIKETIDNSETHDVDHFGVLKLVLHQKSYDWSFHATNGAVPDRGTQTCNGRAGG